MKKLLKYGVFGIIVAEIVYWLTRNPKLWKEIRKAKAWKKLQHIQQDIGSRKNNMIHKLHEIDYKNERNEVKQNISSKEKDLQTHIKKLQGYVDTLGDKKVNQIIADVQQAFDETVDHISDSLHKGNGSSKKKATTVKKTTKASRVAASTKKSASKKKSVSNNKNSSTSGSRTTKKS